MIPTTTPDYKAQAGVKTLFINIALLALSIVFFSLTDFPPLGLLFLAASLLMVRGYTTVTEQKGCILLLFGQYQGSIARPGFYWIHPFMAKKKYPLNRQVTHLSQATFSDLQGIPITAEALLSWEIKLPERAFAQLPVLEKEVRQQGMAALAYLIASLPYFPQANGKTGQKKVGLKGQKVALERKLRENLQKRVEPLGIQIVENSLQQLSPPLSMVSQQQELAFQHKAQKNWAMQSLPLAQHLVKKWKYSENTPKLTEAEEKALLQELIIQLCSPKRG